MEETTSREKVLKKIRNALISKSENPYPSLDIESSVYRNLDDSLDVTFAQEFTKVSGQFIYCENHSELKNNLSTLIDEKGWKNVFSVEPEIIKILEEVNITNYSEDSKLHDVDAGITLCEYLVARTGSIMVSSRQVSGRRLNVIPECHIVIAKSSQLVPDIKDAINNIREKYKENFPSFISLITGPSRTADIEKTLIMGAHGPKELYIFLIDEN